MRTSTITLSGVKRMLQSLKPQEEQFNEINGTNALNNYIAALNYVVDAKADHDWDGDYRMCADARAAYDAIQEFQEQLQQDDPQEQLQP